MEIHFGGLVQLSSAHWTGRECMAVKLAGNNFKCPYSNEPELLEPREEFLIDIKEVERQITQTAIGTENVLFAGGEPTLQQEAIIELARHCKKNRLNVGIATNGSKYFTIKNSLSTHLLILSALR